jgi:hypothetical protein
VIRVWAFVLSWVVAIPVILYGAGYLIAAGSLHVRAAAAVDSVLLRRLIGPSARPVNSIV